ncbi:MAG TPA: 4-hydroxy-tetrahydrodipicolinate reductase [Thermomicrobiales bacterium]|nr:4-hydroxy-tetrahydrodipicolinate reductase [Thermomicrobiales bacterium]
MTPLRIGLIGHTGRMGREIALAAEGQEDVAIIGGVGSGDGAETLRALARDADVLIDFSRPEGTMRAVPVAVAAGTPLVIGTTGLTDDQTGALRETASTIPVWYARNMSHGIGVLQQMLPRIAAALADYDIELVEAHHRHKVDAPSGTALALAEAILRGLEGEVHPLVYGREGHAPRQPGEIGIHAIRGGGNPGEHQVIFASDDEEIRISHRAFHRRVFASGALRAARRLVTLPPGWYAPEEGIEDG